MKILITSQVDETINKIIENAGKKKSLRRSVRNNKSIIDFNCKLNLKFFY